MVKELVISIIIVISIVSVDFITQNYTNDSIAQTSAMLNNLKDQVNKEQDNLQDNIEQISSTWEDKTHKLAYFIEHDELEKVETNLTNIKSFIKVGDTNMIIKSIEEAEFLLDHIKDKNALSLENIF